MIRTIELINFMSHAHTVIEPAKGLTALIGPNNCGKSALVAALQIVSANSKERHMVRHGCRECSVVVTTDDGHTIGWHRKGETVHYTIDGRDHHRLKGGIPEALHDLLKLAPVESVEGDEQFDVHFAAQKEPIFLLNGSGRQAATFFASSSDAARLVAMQQRHKEKIREQAYAEKTVRGQMAGLEQQLATLAAAAELQGAVDASVAMYAALVRENAALAALEHQIAALEGQARAVAAAGDRAAALAGLPAPPAMAETQALDGLIRRMFSTEGQIVCAARERDALTPLAAPPALAETFHFQTLLKTLEMAHHSVAEHTAETFALEALAAPPAIAADTGMARLLSDAHGTQQLLQAHQMEIETLDAALEEVRSHLARYAAEHPACPICGHTLDADMLLQHTQEHAHA